MMSTCDSSRLCLFQYAPLTITCSRAPPTPPQPHGRATHAHGVVGERTGHVNAKLGEPGASKGALQGSLFVYICTRIFFPFFSLHELQWLNFNG